MTITGENLGCVTNVSFGGVDADDATNQEALLDCGSTSTVTVTTPPGTVGTVPVTLSTVESDRPPVSRRRARRSRTPSRRRRR